MPEKYGRCDRQDNCGYQLNPYNDDFEAGDIGKPILSKLYRPEHAPIYFIPETVLNLTLSKYDKNTFIQNLVRLVPVKEDIEQVIALYRLGTIGSGYRKGAVTFPFIDHSNNIRAIQVKLFDKSNHTIATDWIHSIIARDYNENDQVLPEWLLNYSRNDSKVTCLYGEHLLKRFPLNPVALVEAPKTAVVATLYYGLPDNPSQLLWLAVYNKSSLTLEKCKALQGRKVVLFPDLNAYRDWNEKIVSIGRSLPGTSFIVSDILERNASNADRLKGLDLADYLSRFDYKLFRKEYLLRENKTTGMDLPKQNSNTNEKGEKSELATQSFSVVFSEQKPETEKPFDIPQINTTAELEQEDISKRLEVDFGLYCKALPHGRTAIYKSMNEFVHGSPPIKVLSFSEWIEFHITNSDIWYL